MGSSGNQQQLVGQQKTQKGWLSRWTRKQWSRHWFVLKNGSLTYYRGPAAELCSFLDGVLDLSLIKHIEVPQQEEQAVLGHHHHHHHHHLHNHHLSQHHQHYNHHHQHHHLNQISPTQLVSQQPQQVHQQDQQQQQQHFNFSLKMWNGECHLLSASSASERQLWLAAINSCNNYDDETASSDSSSSSSSQSSNISTKSADIGSSHHSSCVVAPTLQALPQPVVPHGNQQQASTQLTPGHETDLKRGPPLPEPVNLAYKQQQQQDKEAEISLEHLALKLKSVVRRRRDVDSVVGQPDESISLKEHSQDTLLNKQQQQQKTLLMRQQQSINSSQKSSSNSTTRATSQQNMKQAALVAETTQALEGHETVGHDELDASEAELNQPQQAHKRRLVCLPTPTSCESPSNELMQVHENGASEIDMEPETPEVGEQDGETTNEDESSARGSQTCSSSSDEEEEESDSSENSEAEDQSMDSSLIGRPSERHELANSQAIVKPKQEQPVGEPVGQLQRQKKRVTFDLSNQSVESASSVATSSGSSSSEDEDDELEGDDDDEAATLSSVSASTSEGEDEQEEEDQDQEQGDNRQKTMDDAMGPRVSANESKGLSVVPGNEERHLFDYAGIKRIEMRRRLELRDQLRYSKQRSSYEDEDSTCELVRRMIERRKLRLQNKDGAAVGKQQQSRDCDKENTQEMRDACDASGAISSSTKMETNQDNENNDNDPIDKSQSPSTTNENNDRNSTTTTSSSSQCNSSSAGCNQNELLLTKQLELEMRLKSAESNADLLERRLSDSYASYNQLEMSYKQLQLELSECRELNVKNMAQLQAKIDELTSELESSELKLLEAKEKLLKHEEHLARWQLTNGASSQQEKPVLKESSHLNHNNNNNNHLQLQQQGHSAPKKSGNNWLTKNYSNSMLLSSTSSGNKLLINLASSLTQQQQQLAGQTTTGQVIHQMKQSLSINQQQLSLKLLSQSKQIQRKLNELELKVDKIQNSNNNNNHLINFNHQQALAVADSSSSPRPTATATTSRD